MVLVEKWRFFQLFFLGNVERENVFFDILERKNACLGYKNNKLKKSKNSHFCKGVNPWFWSKNANFSNFFFRQYWPRKCLLRYSRTKKRLSKLKIASSKSGKIAIFAKGLTHGFGPKLAISPSVFFRH